MPRRFLPLALSALCSALTIAALACGSSSTRRAATATPTSASQQQSARGTASRNPSASATSRPSQTPTEAPTAPAEAGCSGNTADSGSVTLAPGQSFTIPVRSGTFPPEIGELVLSPAPDPAIVRLGTVTSPSENLVGSSLSCWTFQAVAPGTTTIGFGWIYPRPAPGQPSPTPQLQERAPRVIVTVQ